MDYAEIERFSRHAGTDLRIQLPQDPRNVEHMFECPVCTEFMIGLVHICVRGHSLCEKCFLRVTNCPMCRGSMSTARNQFLESFVDYCSFKCRFSEQGCKDMIEGHAYNIHLRECNYRDVQCDMILGMNCPTPAIGYDNFVSHLRLQHNIQTLKNGFELSTTFPKTACIDISTSDLPFGVIEYDNKTFFYNCAKFTIDNDSRALQEYGGNSSQFFLCWWVSVFGTDEERLDYYYTVTLRGRHDKGLQLSWTGPVQNFRKSSQEIYASRDRLAVSSTKLQSLCLPDARNPFFLHSYIEGAFVFKKDDFGL